MNKYFFQYVLANSDEDLEIMFLNPLEDGTYELVGIHNPPGDAGTYESIQEFRDNWDDTINNFRLKLVYE